MTELLRYGSGDSGQHQEMNPVVQTGVTAFDPGASHFGMYSQWPTFPGRYRLLRKWPQHVRLRPAKHIVFPLRDTAGELVPNAYIVGIEEAANNDFQDLVYVLRNVAPYVHGVPGDFNTDGGVDAADYVVWRKNLGMDCAHYPMRTQPWV